MLRRDKKCGCSSSGRAPPCQGGGSEFEPRQPLQTHHQGNTFPCGNRQIRYRNLFLIEVRGPCKSLLLWGVIASSSLVSRSNQTLRICAVISAAVAHLVERHLAKVEVANSSLVSRSKKKTCHRQVFLFGILEIFTAFGRQSRPKVDAATRPRLARARGASMFPSLILTPIKVGSPCKIKGRASKAARHFYSFLLTPAAPQACRAAFQTVPRASGRSAAPQYMRCSP